MKINLLFHSISITKVISTICLLILTISGSHILNVVSAYSGLDNSNEAIERLMKLKFATHTLAVEFKYTNKNRQDSLNKLSPYLSEQVLTHKFFDVSEINTLNAALNEEFHALQLQLSQLSQSELESRLAHFTAQISLTIKEYQLLLEQEEYLNKTSETLAFFLIALCSLFLLVYCRRYVATPLQQLEKNVTSITNHHFNVDFPEFKNEIGVLSSGLQSMSTELESLIVAMQKKVLSKTTELENANETIQFLYTISQQLNTVKLTNAIIIEALNALAKQANLSKLCLELINGVQIDSDYGCASQHPDKKRIPIIINGKPFGYLNYVQEVTVTNNATIIASFSGLLARALYQEEYSLQEQKLLLMEERGVIARELHDSIAQALSFLKIQCTVLHRQIKANEGNDKYKESVNNIEEAVSDAYVQLRSLLSTFRLNISVSDFKEAVLVMISQLQKQTTASIKLGHFETNFQTHANQHIHLLQIVREAIINAMKHANCNNITVSCITIGQKVMLTICDDGIGIDEKPAKDNHYGLEIMNQRATELDAVLEIQNLSVGTEVKLIFTI
ncbi:sensor histidine kinase [Psychromonas sp. RZ22]|uniref:histidine kinase n=1 Tax=Psychromonas algarum TaxID=2555643 RepID=UPI001067D7DD|nr:histidine kinase [Psychromonas sp. RZ22]TEW56077.1 sensor histidine kinase [Psychromonas sp. RZ22]